MSLKFRKRIRVFPGFTINLSRSGMSATIGVKGCSINVGNTGTYLNTGIPGTGLYDRKRIDTPNDNYKNDNIPDKIGTNNYYVETEIKSYNPELLTTDTMTSLKKSILDAENVKKEMYEEWYEANSSKNLTLFGLILLHIIIIGFFLKKIKQNYKDKKRFAEELKKDYEDFSLSIDFNFDKDSLNDYISLKKSFEGVSTAQKVWDITSFRPTDQFHERTTATTSVNRTPIRFFESSLDFIKTEYSALVFENANGGNLFLYPGFIVMKDKISSEFAIIDLKSLQLSFAFSSFIEEESVPSDSKNIGSTWKYCNKNGSRDKRYNNNYQIPIQQYGKFTFQSNEGLNEEFMISNANTCEEFCKYLSNYINVLQNMKWNTVKEGIKGIE